MTASAVKSTQVTNAGTVPVGLSVPGKMGGKVRTWQEKYSVATTSIDEVGDIIHMLRVPSHVVPTSLVLYNTDMDTHSTPTLACDVGVYRADTEVVKDADCFATAITTLQAANTAGVDITYEAGAAGSLGNIGKTLWEIAGYTSDPGIDLLISLTMTTEAATAATGTVGLRLDGVLSN